MRDSASGLPQLVENVASPKERLGTSAGLSRTSVTNIEKGRQVVPVHVLVEFASALGVPLTRLVPEVVAQPSKAALDKVHSLEPARQAWALKFVEQAVGQMESIEDATTIRASSQEGRRTTENRKGRPAAHSRGKAR